jgi:hypothetical protein
MKNFEVALALLAKYLPMVLVGVHAAATVPAAANADKRSVVLAEVTGVSDAVAGASTDSTVQAVGVMIDVAASIINALTAKSAAAGVAGKAA